ncbi:gamma-glutamylcyclotransferase [Paenisporosarcina quisquiliarum]|uniref:Gamma-glutamylcyclotransferase n=1 Tax=Paenisporosarcina quisquiliarum TaxID=365346 RepID=A0A9X3REZ2_9BACL|nr:gamma-glutamylcyclotransferase [Paenisporosarcina quisquiliarum]MCZ8538394.1 gamma-glutamylcyclotransferase [Paenisporosarcina quisquiliarum]
MKLFAYGTLLQGECNHHVLEEAKLLFKGLTLQAIMYDTGNGYPAIELTKDSLVIGDVYDVPDHMWASLDELEGYTGDPKRDLYTKQMVHIQTECGVLDAVVYTVCDEKMKKVVIPSGDWIAYRKARDNK